MQTLLAIVLAIATVHIHAACSSSPPSSADARTPITPPEHALLRDEVLNIAHRGGGLLAPEETLPAFRRATELGVDVLEMDVQLTSDGVVVLMHDTEVDRTTDGVGKLSEMTYAEVLELDAGYRFSPDGGKTFPFRGTGVTVATLREVLNEFPEMLFSIELKEFGATEPVLDLILELGMQEKVVIASFFDAALRKARTYAPEVLTILTLEETIAFVNMSEEEEESYTPPSWIVQTPPSFGDLVVDRELIERANRLGLKVQVWTINDAAEMQQFLDMGVHGIISDDPEKLRELL